MLKVAFFEGEDERGVHVLPLFSPADRVFEKTAAPLLLPEVSKYIETLRPRPDAQYVLLNAMGAGEYWGSNINGDFFSEASLIHRPEGWTGNPLLDRIKSKEWAYGFPTFYFAHPYAHHRNKDASRAFGEVELAAWNPHMKRVELVARVDQKKCQEFGGEGVWDKLRAGEYPAVSMGCRVPFDTCSICLDWDTYRKAQATYKPGKDKSPGEAVLRVHRALQAQGKKGIRGVSITRADYCDHAKKQMNQILPDGRKVWVYNDYPKFFDISFVFIGADRTAKTMMKIAGTGQVWSLPGAELAESLGYAEGPALEEKTASPSDDALKLAFFGKQARNKDAEITKDVVPSQFTGKAVPVLTRTEPDLPKDTLNMLGVSSLGAALSTPTALGIVLRPREFQRIVLVHLGRGELAGELERDERVFPRVEDDYPMPMGPEFFSPILARLLASLVSSRSAFGPAIEKRVLVAHAAPQEKQRESSSLSSNLLRKMGSAYNSYRTGLMELVAYAPDLLASAASPLEEHLQKAASAPIESVFTPLSVSYLKEAFWDEVSVEKQSAAVERGFPSRNTEATSQKISGGY